MISLVGPHEQTAGSLSKLYGSLGSLDTPYLHSCRNRDDVLTPVTPAGVSIPLLGIKDAALSTPLYSCDYCYRYNNSINISDDPTATCPSCRRTFNRVVNYVEPGNVVVREVGIVMDDLDVKPMSTAWTTSSWVSVMKTVDVKNGSALEEREVTLGMNEAVKLLRASMETKSDLDLDLF